MANRMRHGIGARTGIQAVGAGQGDWAARMRPPKASAQAAQPSALGWMPSAALPAVVVVSGCLNRPAAFSPLTASTHHPTV